MGNWERQRGATLVEAALVLPIILLLTLSLLELGLAFREFLTLSFTAREAARVGSLAGNDVEADCHIINEIVAAFGRPTSVTSRFGSSRPAKGPASRKRGWSTPGP